MKNRDVLFDTIGEADEALIPELSGKKTGGRLRTWIALGGLCAAVIVCVILFSWKNENAIRVNFAYGMMGFEGVEVFELSELDTPNPWSPDLELAALPVYRNQMASRYINMARDDYPGVSVSITGEEMERIVQRTAAALHAEILDEKVTLVKDLDYAEIEKLASEKNANCVNQIEASCSGQITVTVSCNGDTSIQFAEPPEFPAASRISETDSAAEKSRKLLAFLCEAYPELLPYDNPVCYHPGARNMYGEDAIYYYVFDETGDPVQDILNYSLHCATIFYVEREFLFSIWLENVYLSDAEYLGDFPIIPEAEARALLLNGDAYTTVPNDYLIDGVLSADEIGTVELVYRCNVWLDEYFIPFYKYYVALKPVPSNHAEGLKRYGAFYVPAIEAEYLEDYHPGLSRSDRATEKPAELPQSSAEYESALAPTMETES